jgi:hypothetical protein
MSDTWTMGGLAAQDQYPMPAPEPIPPGVRRVVINPDQKYVLPEAADDNRMVLGSDPNPRSWTLPVQEQQVSMPTRYEPGDKLLVSDADIDKATGIALGFSGGGLATRGVKPPGAKPPAIGSLFQIPSSQLILPGDFRASTRFPTGVNATENPLTHHLGIGSAEMAHDPGFATNAALLSKVPGFKHLEGMPPEDAVQAYLQQAKDNMNYVFEKSPDVMKQRSPVWYEGAHEIVDALANRWGVPRRVASGVTASLSPQMPWFVNASLGERLGDIMTGAAAGRKLTSEMEAFARDAPGMQKYLLKPDNMKLYRSIVGKSLDALETPEQKALWIRMFDEAHNPKQYREITPEGNFGDFAKTPIGGQLAQVHWGSFDPIEKAVKIMESGGDMNIISPELGAKHKVRSFYNNIETPNDIRFGDVTADTHQVAAAQMRPLGASAPEVNANFGTGGGASSSAVSGVQGLYGITADATRMMAQDQGLLPRAGQSGGWEPVRQLFQDTWKTDKNKAAVDNIWGLKDRGLISTEQARDYIYNLAGGIELPSWARRGLKTTTPAKGSTYR